MKMGASVALTTFRLASVAKYTFLLVQSLVFVPLSPQSSESPQRLDILPLMVQHISFLTNQCSRLSAALKALHRHLFRLPTIVLEAF
jgi:hypothetical protein